MKKITRPVVSRLFPWRAPAAYKGDFGRVLVVAGSRGMCGAGVLCAKSALCAGAGLVYWALPQTMQPSFAAALPEVITLPLAETKTGELAAAAWAQLSAFITRVRPSVIVVGPGMGNSPLLTRLFDRLTVPLVIDADGLNVLATRPRKKFTQPVIYTPHPGEMARLLNQEIARTVSARETQLNRFLQTRGGVCVLKGHHTLVGTLSKKTPEIWENTSGSVALAKGGSGDVLTGIIAGLWAQLGTGYNFTDTALAAAVCGVYVHGVAGEMAAAEKSVYGVLAGDTAAQIGPAIKKILQERK